MRYTLVLNIIFIALCIFFVILSFMINYFFFIPILCFLPFSSRKSYKSKNKATEINTERKFSINVKENELKLQKCPYCRMEILDPEAKYCSQCGKKLQIKY